MQASDDPMLRRPCRAMASAIILQAPRDAHDSALESVAHAWPDSPKCHLLLGLWESTGRSAREREPRLARGVQAQARNELRAWGKKDC